MSHNMKLIKRFFCNWTALHLLQPLRLTCAYLYVVFRDFPLLFCHHNLRLHRRWQWQWHYQKFPSDRLKCNLTSICSLSSQPLCLQLINFQGKDYWNMLRHVEFGPSVPILKQHDHIILALRFPETPIWLYLEKFLFDGIFGNLDICYLIFLGFSNDGTKPTS